MSESTLNKGKGEGEAARIGRAGGAARERALFDAVLREPQELRAAFLAGACAGDEALRSRLLRLLAAHEVASDFLETPAATLDILAPEMEADRWTGRTIGQYRITRLIATGGMGVVYEAQQESPRRTVALKVMRLGLASRSAMARFRLEAEVLGRLEHLGIARIYGAGVHFEQSVREGGTGVPYFAMELVRGGAHESSAPHQPDGLRDVRERLHRPLPITGYADARKLGVRERLELFAKVCDAVQHAHQHGIIHRDLKPGNILVDASGQPKVVDFGVARVTGADLQISTRHTALGELVGTIPYMSPEQIGGRGTEVDTRSDVYSLGVVLYELLSGRVPHDVADATIPEAARLIRESDAAPLSAVSRSLRGDLSTIAGKALEKDRSRRYQSAAELCADIRCYLNDQPIIARPTSAVYQLGKLARRHKPLVAAAGVVAAALLATAIIGSTLAVEAQRGRDAAIAQERIAKAALAESQTVADMLLDLFLGKPDRVSVSRVEMLARAEQRLLEAPIQDPRTEARIREYIGHGYLKAGHRDRTAMHLGRALELRREVVGEEDLDLANCMLLVAMMHFAHGDVDSGRDLLRGTLRIRRAVLGPDHMEQADHGELLFFASLYTPEEPEVAADVEHRRRMREEWEKVVDAGPDRPHAAPGEDLLAAAPVVLLDDFAGPALHDDWRITTEHIASWGSSFDGPGFLISSIEAETAAISSDQPLLPLIQMTRLLEHPIDDFFVRFNLGWRSTDGYQTMQTAGIVLRSRDSIIASVAYTDYWYWWRGGFTAVVGHETSQRLVASSGHDTLPPTGAAEVTIRREGDMVIVFVSGREFLRRHCAGPLTDVVLQISAPQFAGAPTPPRFEGVWIERLSVRGVPAP